MGYLTKASDVKPVEHELDLVLAEKRLLATDVVELTLRDAEGAELPEWHPGAHIDLVLGDDLVRQYSLCGEPDDRSCYRVAVLREPASRGGSVAVHEKLATGDRVKVRGPRNNFHLVSGDSYIFIGGGIGITPLIPMLNAVDTAGASWELHYGGRTEASMAYLEELRSRGEQVHIVMERPPNRMAAMRPTRSTAPPPPHARRRSSRSAVCSASRSSSARAFVWAGSFSSARRKAPSSASPRARRSFPSRYESSASICGA